MKYSKELQVAKEVALSAGEIILKYFDGGQEVQIKEDKSAVTKADILINDLVISELKKSFPGDDIIGEEKSSGDYGLGRKWFCDPIDGTAGYVWGLPTATFSLALVADGKPVMGVVYDAFLKRLYQAEANQGSYCNQRQLNVSNKPDLSGSHVGVTSDVCKLKSLKYVNALQEAGSYLPVFSGAVYKSCLVARGKFEGYIETGVGTHDMAAVQVIVEEAGGKITGLDGSALNYTEPFNGAIVSNGLVHDQLVALVGN